jgi:hypothetical protein
MIASDYTAMSTQRLLQLFGEAAKSTPTVYAEWETAFTTGVSDAVKPSPERNARVATLKAVAAALAARKPLPNLRQFFEDDDINVRAWAAGQFMKVEPEWAYAAMEGVMCGLPTREVLDLIRRASEEPPAEPALKDMTDDALVARFEDAATREYATRFLDVVDDADDIDTSNRILEEVWDIMRALKARDRLDRLAPLLDSPNPTVRREAAIGCLRVDEPRAVQVLKALGATGRDDDKYPARRALAAWRKKGVVVYGV